MKKYQSLWWLMEKICKKERKKSADAHVAFALANNLRLRSSDDWKIIKRYQAYRNFFFLKYVTFLSLENKFCWLYVLCLYFRWTCFREVKVVTGWSREELLKILQRSTFLEIFFFFRLPVVLTNILALRLEFFLKDVLTMMWSSLEGIVFDIWEMRFRVWSLWG